MRSSRKAGRRIKLSSLSADRLSVFTETPEFTDATRQGRAAN